MIDGVELFRSQGRAQMLQDVLDLESQVARTLAPVKMPQPLKNMDHSFGQKDNPHFAK